MQPDTDSELSDARDLAIEERKPLESLLIERMSQISQVESLYNYEDEDCTTFFTILDTTRYQRDVNMKVYEVEYTLLRQFPDATAAFRCIPRLGMLDEDYLPTGAVRLYKRPEDRYYGKPSGTSDTSAA